MKHIALILISVFIVIVGIGCVSAAGSDVSGIDDSVGSWWNQDVHVFADGIVGSWWNRDVHVFADGIVGSWWNRDVHVFADGIVGSWWNDKPHQY